MLKKNKQSQSTTVPLFHIDSSINSLMLCTMFMCVFAGGGVFWERGRAGAEAFPTLVGNLLF